MTPLRVCIVGGIFDQSEEYRSKHLLTPETVLAAGLRECGTAVDTCGHRHFEPTNAYDIVHVHHLGKAALRMATAETGSLFVYTSHDGNLICGHRVSRVHRLVTKFILNRADAVVTLSMIEQRAMERLFGHYNAATATIANGFPTNLFYHNKRSMQRTGPYKLLFVGQLIEQKGVGVLLKALRIVRQSKDVDASLVYQNASLEAHYKGLTAQLGLEAHVHFVGFKSVFDLADIYRQVDLFVLPTFAEALPSVVTEAMMSGLPLVASRVGGIPEQVGPHGILVPPGDVDALAGAIIRTLDTLAIGTLQPETVSAYAAAKFSVQAMVEKHLRLYEDLKR
ncbi:MAG: glycosyltransferase family 4 protein, partial [Dehalococcoidia bacterium]